MHTDARRQRSDALRSFAGQRVLVVGALAESAALRAVLRDGGARVMASTDVEMAITLLTRFAMDVVLVEPQLQTADGEPFVTVLRRRGGASSGARTIALAWTHRRAAPVGT